MKKFLAISAGFLVAIIAIFITLGCIKPQTKLVYDDPKTVMVYAKSSTAVKNGLGDNNFSATSKTYKNIVERTQEMFKISMLEYLIHGDKAVSIVDQDIANTYATYSSSLLSSKYAVALSFEKTQEQVVTYQGDKKTIKYQKIIILIDPDKNYQQVPIYFSTSSEGSSYEKAPMVMNIKAASLVEYINEIK